MQVNYDLREITVPGTGVKYYVNNDIPMLNNFDYIIPKYDETNGIHLELIVDGKKHIVQIKREVYRKYVAPEDLNSDEFRRAYMETRCEIARHIVSQTYMKAYETPSAVQKISIVGLIMGKDAVVQSKSGTGKTHAFLTGLLWNYDPYDAGLQSVFITSSHEVATQIYEQALDLLPKSAKISLCIGHKRTGRTHGGFKSVSTGGKSLYQQINEIKQAQVLVCTMGKFYDLYINRGVINTEYLKTLCVDEFDSIVSSNGNRSNANNTEDQMAQIIMDIPEFTQRAFFSATNDVCSAEIANSYIRPYDHDDDEPITDFDNDNRGPGKPLIISLDSCDNTLDGINQYYVPVHNDREKNDVLTDLVTQCRVNQVCIFANTKARVIAIADLFRDYSRINNIIMPHSSVMHSDMSSNDRNKTFEEFKEGKTRMLIATDVAARGVDVQSVSMVINYDMPDDLATYVHRIGRSGRYGRKGTAISFVTITGSCNEMIKIDEINKISLHTEVEPLPEHVVNIAE